MRLAATIAILLLVGPPSLAGTGAAAAASSTPAPTSLAKPTVAGSPTEGRRLVASPGRTPGSDHVVHAYQWYRCDTMGAHCTALRGATERTRKLGPSDVGHTIGLEVRGTTADGSALGVEYASLVGPVAGAPSLLASSGQPVVFGAAVPGGTVGVKTGGWNPRPSSFSFQWARCDSNARACVPITGATGDRHQVDAADLDHVLVAIVQARSGAISRAVFSVATPRVIAAELAPPETAPPTAAPPTAAPPKAAPPAAAPPVAPAAPAAPAAPDTVGPANAAPPLVAEVVEQGSRLTGNVGFWSSSLGTPTYAYQWYRCDRAGAHCNSIHGATGLTYTQVAKDVGQTLGFAVRATDSSGTSSAYASLVGPVAPAGSMFASSGQPTIAGAATQGRPLAVSAGGWTQNPTTTSYQWQRCNQYGRLCAAIAGATEPTYTAGAADVGHSLLVVVHATSQTGSGDALSVATRPVEPAPGPTNTAAPTLTGAIQAGKQLTGASGTWSGTGTIGYAYQWYRCDPTGSRCNSIRGATRATYTQVAKDVGQAVALAVRASDKNGTATAFTGVLGVVARADATLVATAQPTIAGTAAQGQALQVSNGAWSEPPASFSFAWGRCDASGRHCVAIDGATASAYTVTPADAGHRLLALVTATAAGVTQGAISLPTAAVP